VDEEIDIWSRVCEIFDDKILLPVLGHPVQKVALHLSP